MTGSWVLTDDQGTALHFFDDGCVVFNPTRWETHLVDLLVGTLLEELQQGARTEQVLTQVAVDASDLNESEAAQFTREALSQLTALELITETPPRAHR